MALIQCPDCGKDISDLASSCIHCGRPLDFKKNEIKQNVKHKVENLSQHQIPSLEVKKLKLDTDSFYYSSKKYDYKNIVGMFYQYESVTVNFVNSKSAKIKFKLKDGNVLSISAGGAFQKKNIQKN